MQQQPCVMCVEIRTWQLDTWKNTCSSIPHMHWRSYCGVFGLLWPWSWGATHPQMLSGPPRTPHYKKTMIVVDLLCKQWQWHHDTNKTLFAPDTSSGSRPSRRWWKRWASRLGSGRCWTRPPCPARPGGRRPPWPPRGWRWGDHWIARRQPLCRSGKKNLYWKKDSLSKDDLVGGDEQLRDRLVLCLAVDEHLRNTTILYWCSKILTFVSDLRNHMKKNHEIWETIWKTSTRVWKILEDVIDVRKDIALAMNWKPYEREPQESKKWQRLVLGLAVDQHLVLVVASLQNLVEQSHVADVF